MGNFFNGWRRKAGCVALVTACVLMIAWLRSLLIFDQFVIFDNNEFGPCGLIISQSGSLYFQETSHTFGRMPFYRSDKVGRSVSAFGFLNGFTGASCVGVNYWYIVLPMSVLSAYLLLRNPRKQNQKVPSRP